MRRNFGRELTGSLAARAVRPQIPNGDRAGQAELRPSRGYGGSPIAAIEQAHGLRAIGQGSRPDLEISVLGHSFGNLAQLVLIDGDDFRIGQNVAVSFDMLCRSFPANRGAASRL